MAKSGRAGWRCIIAAYLVTSWGLTAAAMGAEVSSGPLVGYSTHFEVGIWLQTTKSTSVRIKYWSESNPTSVAVSPFQETGKNHIVKIRIADLEPGQKYRFTVELGRDENRVFNPRWPLRFQTQALWRRFKNRAPPNFVVALGSCAHTTDTEYDPKPYYSGGYEIYEAIRKQAPDMMLWLGDNVYFRASDWSSPGGMARRYRRSRKLPQLQALLGSTHHYAIWDDHDYGPNDSNRSFVHKQASLDAFKRHWFNPSYGLPNVPGVFTQFTWHDVDFFLLDNRYHRSASNAPREPEKTQFGKDQFHWLADALAASKAPFKVVAAGGQFLSPFDRYEGSAQFPHEQKQLIDMLIRRNVNGVVFISGDRHHTELVKIHPQGFYPLYDFTASPLTSRGAAADGEWDSPVRVPGTLVTKKRNFGMLRVSGAAESRSLTFESRDSKGQLLWTHSINASSLRIAKSNSGRRH
ncbi:MAG: alkaline phosphatase D family protein [Myxococcota bacterium]|nr:alkaline phosphatase D family protein [Myxococcota bacterium]